MGTPDVDILFQVQLPLLAIGESSTFWIICKLKKTKTKKQNHLSLTSLAWLS